MPNTVLLCAVFTCGVHIQKNLECIHGHFLVVR